MSGPSPHTLSALTLDAGLTLEDVARVTGVKRDEVHRWVASSSAPEHTPIPWSEWQFLRMAIGEPEPFDLLSHCRELRRKVQYGEISVEQAREFLGDVYGAMTCEERRREIDQLSIGCDF